jgi:hypothetical protein
MVNLDEIETQKLLRNMDNRDPIVIRVNKVLIPEK